MRMCSTRNDKLKFLGKLFILAFGCYSTIKTAKFVSKKRETHEPSRIRFNWSIFSAEESSNMFIYDGFSLLDNKSCMCQNEKEMLTYQLQDIFNPDEIELVKKRRKMELSHFQRRYAFQDQKVLLAEPNSPLSYPIHGVEVNPLHTILVPGLRIHRPDDEMFGVTLRASLGTLNTLMVVSEKMVQGRGKNHLIISTMDVASLNYILQHITYTSSVYHVQALDIVTFELGSHVVRFPVVIRQPNIAKLYDPGADKKISSLVTITTKTFLRYHKLRILIKSIRQYYPDMTIIVADDSDPPEKLQEPHVEQYFMPYAKGWFAGRNLAVSQVTTKYFLWIDDDFLFNEKTKIEKLVDVLEKTNLDVVSGGANGRFFNFKLLLQEGDEDGDCLHMRPGFYHPLEGFPNCVVTGGVVNFFLAHTEKIRSVGFDPKYQRVAHPELFIDGLGTLLVGSCRDVSVGHQKKDTPSDPKLVNVEKIYATFRNEKQDEFQSKLARIFFKNNLKCYTRKSI
ncbi:beta-1,4 N-acetylgalactosaminyltransferase 2 isoform X1 [Rhinatrema bivittatum]|uniref:beta-1,4 N-acetylgalactosaminyltransferase 2 isoform X1 n=1 Tax=Rhinatrema bivittatum TaxID=194408 RepID=UPI00112A1A14|nr:beta-1,4 N-acetylgalactosaminyltransferase 2 isoform X1 [Rhinatrema bivittatum]